MHAILSPPILLSLAYPIDRRSPSLPYLPYQVDCPQVFLLSAIVATKNLKWHDLGQANISVYEGGIKATKPAVFKLEYLRLDYVISSEPGWLSIILGWSN